MFTGIVERTAKVAALEDRPGRRVITIDVTNDQPLPPWPPAAVGESIALNGVCLTVVATRSRQGGEAVSFDAVPETLERTTLGRLRVGEAVNIERSLRVGDRFGGHYVTGHVDGVATVRSRERQGDQVLFRIDAPAGLLRQILPKGSVAVDGISLTVIDVDSKESWFSFAVIPHTLEWTNLGARAVRSAVNIETDAFGKWVLHAMGLSTGVALPDASASADERLRRLLDAGEHDAPVHPDPI